MIQSQIAKVLFTFLKYDVKSLLIGGQACILYGGVEFSRDIDFTVMISPDNLNSITLALKELKGELVYFPNLSENVLRSGHACHFRCQEDDVKGLRIDILGNMRNVDPFSELWKRRELIEINGVGFIAVLGITDLIKAKKTQRDRDWPMIRRLVEVDILRNSDNPSEEKIFLWFQECRTPEILISLAKKYPEKALERTLARPLLRYIKEDNVDLIRTKLREEEDGEREQDRIYWTPLKKEL